LSLGEQYLLQTSYAQKKLHVKRAEEIWEMRNRAVRVMKYDPHLVSDYHIARYLLFWLHSSLRAHYLVIVYYSYSHNSRPERTYHQNNFPIVPDKV
jgi:hypothetical protein